MDGTTAIKIDYYEELKAKADKQDPVKVVTRKFETFIASFCGSCEKTLWEGTTNYCYHCGQRLEWHK